ncbi:MAG: aquaporin [Solirubrobacterales bacterium]
MHKRSITGALVAEFIGTFALVFSIVVAVALYSLQADVARGLTFPFIAMAHGLALFFMIQTVGAISGGHFNPAITVALLAIRKIAPSTAVLYIVVQLAGALVAALVAKALIGDPMETVRGATTQINTGEIEPAGAMFFEAIVTFFLVWVVVGTAVNPDGPKEWAPLAISGTLALGILLVGPLTGGSLNPARSFGPALIFNEFGEIGDYLMAYVAGPVLGGVIAAVLYKLLYLEGDGDERSLRPPAPPAPSEQSPL